MPAFSLKGSKSAYQISTTQQQEHSRSVADAVFKMPISAELSLRQHRADLYVSDNTPQQHSKEQTKRQAIQRKLRYGKNHANRLMMSDSGIPAAH